ncbi:MAG: sodium:proton antiporter, partial [Pseudarthrobacter sp.]|nr:sodium:proton antiporter [Pseudarthrobacter sp.]
MSPEPNVVDGIIDTLTAVFLVVGALMSLAAAVGLLRFPDLLSRMHAATKPQVLGLFLLLAAIGLQMRTLWVWPVLLVAWIFQLLTVPVSAHMVGRSGYRTKHLHRELLSS